MRTNELHCSAKQVQRSAGRSSVAAAAYRSATQLVDERTGLIHDYTKKQGVEHTRIYMPDNAPAWANDRNKLWNAAEAKENRKNSMTARELEIAFPHEFNVMQRREAGDAVSRELMHRYNCAVDIAYHEPNKNGDDRNYHAHILFTTRGFDENSKDGWERTKYRDLNKDQITIDGEKFQRSTLEIKALREFTAKQMNIIAEREKLDVHTEHLSFETRGIDLEPTKKMGVKATAMERRGELSERGEENRKVQAANDNYHKLNNDINVINLEIERENRRIEKEQQTQRESQKLDQEENQKTTVRQKFNEEAKEEGVATAPRSAGNSYTQKTTAELANEFLQLARNPLQDLRGWLDETQEGQGRKNDIDSLSSGQATSGGMVDELRQMGSATDAAETTAEQPEHFDRDRYETEQNKRIEAAALAHAKEQEENAVLSEKLEKLNIPRFVRLKEVRQEWADLKTAQTKEKAALVVRLKNELTTDQKATRERLNKYIGDQQTEKNKVAQELGEKGLKAFFVRLRYGDEMRKELVWRDENISDAIMRRDEGSGHLSKYDNSRIQQLKRTHQQQRDTLRREQKEDLHAIENTRTEQEEKLLQQAQASPERAAELKGVVNTKTEKGKAQAAQIATIEREHKQDKRAVNLPEHEEQQQQELPRPTLSDKGLTMSNDTKDTPSRGKWETTANVSQAETDAARAQQLNISIEELAARDEAARLGNLREDYQAAMETPAEAETELQESLEEHYNRIMEQSDHEIDSPDKDSPTPDIER